MMMESPNEYVEPAATVEKESKKEGEQWDLGSRATHQIGGRGARASQHHCAVRRAQSSNKKRSGNKSENWQRWS